METTLKTPRVLQRIGLESRRKGTDKLTTREINRIIQAARRNTR